MKTLPEAVAAFLGPLMAEYARLIEESDRDTVVTIMFGHHGYRTTLGVIQDLDRAYAETFERNHKAACRRRDRKAVGRLV
jgi:hypothetical protein